MSRNRVALAGDPIAVGRYCSTMSFGTTRRLRASLRPWRASYNALMTVALVFTFLTPLVASASPATAATQNTWVDENVSFTSGTMTIYATFRHPTDAKVVPAVLLIAGSGPTDRNGNSALEPGPVDTLKT